MAFRIGRIIRPCNRTHYFIVALEGEDLVFYAGGGDIHGHANLAKTVNASKVVGGGLVSTIGSFHLELCSDSTTFGGVPKEVIEGWKEALLDAYSTESRRPDLFSVDTHISDERKEMWDKKEFERLAEKIV